MLQDRTEANRYDDREREGAQDIASNGCDSCSAAPRDRSGDDEEHAWARRQDDDYRRYGVLPDPAGDDKHHEGRFAIELTRRA